MSSSKGTGPQPKQSTVRRPINESKGSGTKPVGGTGPKPNKK